MKFNLSYLTRLAKTCQVPRIRIDCSMARDMGMGMNIGIGIGIDIDIGIGIGMEHGYKVYKSKLYLEYTYGYKVCKLTHI